MTSILKRIFGDNDAETVAAEAGDGSIVKAKVEPVHVTDADFEEIILKAGVPAVVDLWAEWCGPCHMIAPSVEQMANEFDGRAIVAKMNVDENPAVPANLGIMGIPTLIYFKDGQEVDRQVGVARYEQLANKMENLLD